MGACTAASTSWSSSRSRTGFGSIPRRAARLVALRTRAWCRCSRRHCTLRSCGWWQWTLPSRSCSGLMLRTGARTVAGSPSSSLAASCSPAPSLTAMCMAGTSSDPGQVRNHCPTPLSAYPLPNPYNYLPPYHCRSAWGRASNFSGRAARSRGLSER